MIAGKLDQRLIVYRKVERADGFGALPTRWEPAATIWAERVNETARRVDEVQEHFPDHTAAFNIRIAHNVEENSRVKHLGGHLYTVTSVVKNRRRGMQTIYCERVNE